MPYQNYYHTCLMYDFLFELIPRLGKIFISITHTSLNSKTDFPLQCFTYQVHFYIVKHIALFISLLVTILEDLRRFSKRRNGEKNNNDFFFSDTSKISTGFHNRICHVIESCININICETQLVPCMGEYVWVYFPLGFNGPIMTQLFIINIISN